MTKYFSLLAIAMVLFASSCQKKENVASEKNENPITLSQEYADLQNSLYELNQEMITSSPETRSPRRWIAVGISDAVGAACGFRFGGVAGSIILGALASAIEIIETQPMENNSTVVNDLKVEEQEFQNALKTLMDQSGAQVGVFHNQVIRAVYGENSDDIPEMTTEELVPLFREALPEEYKNELSLTNEELSESVQDLIYYPESGETTTAYIFRLGLKYPESRHDLIVLKPILDGIDASESDQAALEYTTRAMAIIEHSKVASKSKNTLLCGASVAFESKVLWNLSENQNN
ncbi:MAG: hypothetical protein IKV62_05890 [Bacteroidales bacterium]|nr:hypothetical protein [Bacteroidales bacterium]